MMKRNHGESLADHAKRLEDGANVCAGVPDHPPLSARYVCERARWERLSADEHETARTRLVGRLIDLCESVEQPVDVVVAMALLLSDCEQWDRERQTSRDLIAKHADPTRGAFR